MRPYETKALDPRDGHRIKKNRFCPIDCIETLSIVTIDISVETIDIFDIDNRLQRTLARFYEVDLT